MDTSITVFDWFQHWHVLSVSQPRHFTWNLPYYPNSFLQCTHICDLQSLVAVWLSGNTFTTSSQVFITLCLVQLVHKSAGEKPESCQIRSSQLLSGHPDLHLHMDYSGWQPQKDEWRGNTGHTVLHYYLPVLLFSFFPELLSRINSTITLLCTDDIHTHKA